MGTEDLFQSMPYKRFKEFIAPDIDRYIVLCSILDECSLSYKVLELQGKRHIVVSPFVDSASALDLSVLKHSSFILTAHYDRVPMSPGANDNGASVFMLLDTALFLRNNALKTAQGEVLNKTLIIFTDGEELSAGESLTMQGSYRLGLCLKKNNIGNKGIFTFDACGTGDTLIISTAAEELLKNETGDNAQTARKKAQDLRTIALETARKIRLDNVMLLPTPFSEDAGFLLAGRLAQTITVLPQNEASACSSLVRNGKSKALLYNTFDRRHIPATWQCLNGPADSPLRLTTEHWKMTVAFAKALADWQG